MTSSEDFKQAIRAGNISEAFLVAMSNAPKLDITTRIISAPGNVRETNTNQFQVDNYLRTHINLIEGKIENEIGEQLTSDRYSEIKQFHIQQVNQGHQTIQHNLISLQKMFQLMSAFQQQQQTSKHLNWVDIAADVTRESLPAKPETNQLYGNNSPDVLEAGETENTTEAISLGVNSNIVGTDKPEPQLPSFEAEEEDDSVVDDLLSLADIDDDDDPEQEEQAQEKQEDWSEWLEDEPDVRAEVLDLKSINIREAAQNWQNLESQHPYNSQSSTEQH